MKTKNLLEYEHFNMKELLLVITFLLSSNILYGQKVTKNRSYNFSAFNTVAIIPYFNEEEQPEKNDLDGLIQKAFSSSFTLCCQAEIRHNIMNNRTFSGLVNRVAYSGFLDDASTKPNLFSSLNEDEQRVLETGFENVDLIIVTSDILSQTIRKINGKGSISLSGGITVYDLRNGAFVVGISNKIKRKFQDSSSASFPMDELMKSLSNELVKVFDR